MSTFVDTSAWLAVLDADDAQHARAARAWRDLVNADEPLLTTNYVLLETCAVAQSRLGLDAVQTLSDDIAPMVQIVWIDAGAHSMALTALRTAQRRQLSLVDCISFEIIRRVGARQVFAYDRHFRQQGFALVQ